MKKRVLSIFLALALCAGLAVPALAADAGSFAELYTYISDDFPYVSQNLEYKVRTIGDDGKLGEAQACHDTFNVIPASEYFRVGVRKLAKDEEMAIIIQAYSDPDGDGVYDQRLFQTKRNAEGVIEGVSVMPLPKDGAYKRTDNEIDFAPAIVMPEFVKMRDGDYVFNADKLHEMFGDNTQIRFISLESKEVLGEVLLSAGAFDDVPGLGWYSEPIAWAADQGIAAGVGDGNFGPDYDCTHIQILTFLSRAAGNTSAADYDWAAEQIAVIKWAKEKGMIGEDFDSGKPCTRAEAVNYIWQAKDKPSAAASNFTDMEGYEEYAKAVDWANEKKITTGVGNNMFAPGSTCNRAYIATFLYRAYND